MVDVPFLALSAPSTLPVSYLLLIISIQNQLSCCENIGIDHTLQAIQYEKQILPNCLGKFSNLSLVMFGVERVL